MTFGVLSVLSAMESSFVTAVCRSSKYSGLMPLRMSAQASSSRKLVSVCKKTRVASLASGLSTYTGKCGWPCTMPASLIWRMKYSSSCVRPTANDGMTTLPPRSSVRWMQSASAVR